MKTLIKPLFVLILGTLSLQAFSQTKSDTLTVTGTIVDEKNEPVPGATIVTLTSKTQALTDVTGKFSIKSVKGDKLRIAYIGYETQVITVGNESNLNIKLTPSKALIKEVLVSATVSSYSYWSGAKLSYNVNGKSTGSNNIVGGASVIINSFSDKYAGAQLDIVGNIGNFSSSGTDAQNQQMISKLAQDEAGLSIGIGATWEKVFGSNDEFTLRPFLFTGYKLNTFSKTSSKDSSSKMIVDTTSSSLNQWHNTVGVELEGFRLSQGGKLHIGCAISYDMFDANEYFKAFDKRKSSLLSLNANLILPLSTKFGFLIDATYSKQFAPLYSMGIIIKNMK